MIKDIIATREKEERREDDSVQYLMDKGDSLLGIIKYVLGSVLAGQINTGVNAAWILAWLGSSPEWLAKARAEIEEAAFKHGATGTTLSEQLRTVPLTAWETDFPLIYACINESIRITLVGTSPRYNEKGDIQIGDSVIPGGAFVTYAPFDVHQDPSIYPNPLEWDPARFLPGREEHKKSKLAYLGWGAGRHPCLGMRFANLEMVMIVAFFVATYDWDVILPKDAKKSGAPGLALRDVPKVDLNKKAAEIPRLSERVFLRYRQRKDGV